MARRLTLKQLKFAMYLIGAVNGNQTLAARLAGYKGNARQLAVQGSVNMKNPAIMQMIKDGLGPLVEPSFKVLAEGLSATKRRPFLTQDGEIVYSEPEPHHAVRTKTANQILDRYEHCDRNDSGADAVVHEDGEATEGSEAHGDDSDEVMFRLATELKAQLEKLDRGSDDNHDDVGTPEDGHGGDGTGESK